MPESGCSAALAGGGKVGVAGCRLLKSAGRYNQTVTWRQAKATDYPSRRQPQALTAKILGYVFGYVFGYVETENTPEVA
jgi:hypothetical protein